MISPQRVSRVITTLVVRSPRLWRLFRGRMRKVFDALAPEWDSILLPDSHAPLEAALDRVEPPPRRVLDLGTGTGAAAFAIARRWPGLEVVGVDLSARMVDVARGNTPEELRGRVSFEVGDAAALPFGAGAFELVVLANMIPFFDELARVVAPGGYAAFAFSRGDDTPIYVAPGRLRAELERRGFGEFAEVAAGRGTAFLARRTPTM